MDECENEIFLILGKWNNWFSCFFFVLQNDMLIKEKDQSSSNKVNYSCSECKKKTKKQTKKMEKGKCKNILVFINCKYVCYFNESEWFLEV